MEHLRKKKASLIEESMRNEFLRLQTFKDFRISLNVQVSPIQFAQAGFYVEEKHGRVQCFSCGCECNEPFTSISLENAHEPYCRRLELNQPVGSGSHGLFQQSLSQKFDQCSHLPSGYQNGQMEFSETRTIDKNDDGDNEDMSGAVSGSGVTQSEKVPMDSQLVPHLGSITSFQLNSVANIRTSRSTVQASGQTNRFSTENVNVSQLSTVSPSGSYSTLPGIQINAQTNTSPILLNTETSIQSSQLSTVNVDVSQRPNRNLSFVSYPYFSTRRARMTSFVNWHPIPVHCPEDFAEAGFFYAGYADCVRCFCCGLGLKFWRADDVITFQHARFRPTCAFNLLYKGQVYIDRVQQEVLTQQETVNRGLTQTSSESQSVPATTTTGDVRHEACVSPASRSTTAVSTTISRSTATTTSTATAASAATAFSAATFISIATVLGTATVARDTPAGRCAPSSQRVPSLDRVQSARYISNEDSGVFLAGHDARESSPEPSNSGPAEMRVDPQQQERTAPRNLNEELRVLERENKHLSERTKCRGCREEEVNCVFLPCGHVVMCQGCADKATHCIFCAKTIIGTANVFLA